MTAGPSQDAGAPTIEVRIYRAGELVVRELAETEEDAAAVVERWSELGNVYVLVDDLSAHHGPGDILAPELLVTDDDYPTDVATGPGRGTEQELTS